MSIDSIRDVNADQKHDQHHQERDQPPQMMVTLRSHAVPVDVPRHLKRLSEHRSTPFHRPQETFTSIAFGFAFSDLGRCTFKTPSLYSALTLLPSASSGKVKLRIKLP